VKASTLEPAPAALAAPAYVPAAWALREGPLEPLTGTGRDVSLDLLGGLAMVILVVSHRAWSPPSAT
jgi:hypothetical protein